MNRVCLRILLKDLLYKVWLKSYIRRKSFAVFDAIGKIPPGMFAGALVFWGYYPECKQISYNYPGRQRLWEAEYSRYVLKPVPEII